VVSRVVTVKHEFEPVDEWHTTSILVELMLRTGKAVPAKLLEDWVRSHWGEVQALAGTVKTPPPAPAYSSRERYYDDDDYGDGDSDWQQDVPEPGLGWLTAKNTNPARFEGVSVRQQDRKAVARINVSIR
jgi:hypothetical protein